MTKHELQQYQAMDAEIKRVEDKIMELESRLTSPKSPSLSGMPRGGEHKDMADRVAELVELKNLYEKRWDELINKRLEIEKAINKLEDSTERALMGYKYIDGLTWEEVCVKISYSWRQTHRLHSNALQKIKGA